MMGRRIFPIVFYENTCVCGHFGHKHNMWGECFEVDEVCDCEDVGFLSLLEFALRRDRRNGDCTWPWCECENRKLRDE